MLIAALYGLLSALLWGVTDFLSRKPSTDIGYYLTSSYIQLVGFAVLVAFGLTSRSLDVSAIGAERVFFAISLASGFFVFIALVFLYRGYASGAMSIVAPIEGAYPVVTIALSFLLLNQSLTALNALGVSTTIVGIVLAGIRTQRLQIRPAPRDEKEQDRKSLPRGSGAKGTLAAGVDSAILACVFTGLSLFCSGYVSSSLGWLLTTTIMKGMGTVTGFGLLLPLGRRLEKPKPRTTLWLVLLGTMDALGFVAFNYGIVSAGNYLPIVSTLSGLIGIVTLSLAIVFYKETLSRVQTLGIIVLSLGVLTLLYF